MASWCVWLGKTELSDEHLLYSSGEITHHRTIRRFAETDPRRWQKESILDMKVTPWATKETNRGEQDTAQGADLDAGLRLGGTTLGQKSHILPLRQRPQTPGCAACARTGQPSHGFRHSVKCREEMRQWLDNRWDHREFMNHQYLRLNFQV